MVSEVDAQLRHLTEPVLKRHLHAVAVPVIRLSDGVTIHHRTDAHLDLDLALVSRSLAALAACTDAKLAVSISGQMLATLLGCSVLCNFQAAQVGLCGRLKIIIMSSEEIEDLSCVARSVTLL